MVPDPAVRRMPMIKNSAQIHALTFFMVTFLFSASSAVLASPLDREPEDNDRNSSQEPWNDECPTERVSMHGMGGRISVLRLSGSDADDTGRGLGLSFSGYSERYTMTHLSSRVSSFVFLGGGSLGMEGGLGLDAATGFRFPAGGHQGLVLRLGLRTSLVGDDKFLESLIEIPQLQLGYQWMKSNRMVEIAGRAGAVLAGRFKPGDEAARKLGKSFDVGGHGALHWDSLHFDLQHTRVWLEGPAADVDFIFGRVCGDLAWFQLCVDSRIDRGGVFLPGPDDATATATSIYSGLSFGTNDSWWNSGRRGDRRRASLPILTPSLW
jgi:hypothetical protein